MPPPARAACDLLRAPRQRWLALCLAVLALAVPGASAAAPNIVVVMTDDLSVDAYEAMLQGGFLPEIREHLIDAGVRFENSFVTNSTCCPSRATFLTGQYSHNHKVYSNHSNYPLLGGIAWRGWLPTLEEPGRNESTIATWLQDAGYYTALVGKHLNGYGVVAPEGMATPKTYIPPGWTEWYGLIDPTTYRVYDFDLNENGSIVHYGEAESDYQTDVLAARAVDVIQNGLVTGKPLFLTVMPLAPHIEVLDPKATLLGNDPAAGFELQIRPAPRHEHLSDGDPDNGEVPDRPSKLSFNETDLRDKPSCLPSVPPWGLIVVEEPFCVGDRPWIDPDLKLPLLENQWKTMLASLVAVDDLVGTIVAELAAAGELSNTVLVFTSDNGWFYGEHRLIGKELAYEEAIRVPLVVRAPGAAAGAQSDKIVLNNDLAPTFARLANAEPAHLPDGVSIAPLLADPAGDGWHRKGFLVERWFVPSPAKFENPTFLALRRLVPAVDFLYVASYTDPKDLEQATHHELYNLDMDPYQVHSIPLADSVTPAIDQYLLNFRACRGQSCWAFEAN